MVQGVHILGGREKRKYLIPPGTAYRGSEVLSEKRHPRWTFAKTGDLNDCGTFWGTLRQL